MDTPYRIEPDKRGYEIVYDIHRTGEGRIATVYSMGNALKIINALNKAELERFMAKAV